MPASNSYASLYFTDIQEHGYQSFEADVGLNASVGSACLALCAVVEARKRFEA